MRWLAERKEKKAAGDHAESDVSSGSLAASVYIAGAALAGLLIVVPMDTKRALTAEAERAAGRVVGVEWGDIGARLWPGLQGSDLAALVMFVVLAAALYVMARKKLEA